MGPRLLFSDKWHRLWGRGWELQTVEVGKHSLHLGIWADSSKLKAWAGKGGIRSRVSSSNPDPLCAALPEVDIFTWGFYPNFSDVWNKF